MKRIAYWQVAAAMLLVTGSLSADWMQFRGPGGNGRSEEKNLPATWSEQENLAWKLELPGLGTSSPIVVGNRVFVTCYSGYAASADAPGEMNNLQRHVVCVDRNSGKILWKADVKPELPESLYEGGNNARHGYASSTPVSDGRNLFVFFGKSGVLCFDLDGKQLWQTSVGTGVTGWGSSNSPVLFKDSVIVNAAVESGAVVALEKATGKEKWRTKGTAKAWTTPHLIQNGDKYELILNVPERVFALDPQTGEELWHCDGSPDSYLCPSPISHDGIIYVVCGRRGDGVGLAIKPGGRGDVTNTHVVWRSQISNRVPSPVYEEGHLFWASDDGMLFCVNATNGEQVFQERIQPSTGTVYSSPVVADGKLYCVSQLNGTYVFAANPKFELIAHNKLGEEGYRANASPAIDRGNILIRDDKFLYCIGPGNRVARAK
jgi:outer membrane protein assembly factor BamB